MRWALNVSAPGIVSCLSHLSLNHLERQGEPDRAALSFNTFGMYGTAMYFNERLHDGQAQARTFNPIGIPFPLLENLSEAVCGYALACIAYPAFNQVVFRPLHRPYPDLPTQRVGDGVADEILEDPLHQARISEDDEVHGHFV